MSWEGLHASLGICSLSLTQQPCLRFVLFFFAAPSPSPVAAENGAPDSFSAGLIILEMVEFLFVLLSYCHLSKYDDIAHKFKLYM